MGDGPFGVGRSSLPLWERGWCPLELDKKRAVADALLERVWPHLGTKIDPVIDSVYPLEQAAAAHARMESSQHIGKILLEVRP